MKTLMGPSVALKIVKTSIPFNELSPRDQNRYSGAINQLVSHACWMYDQLQNDDTSRLYLYLIELPSGWARMSSNERNNHPFYVTEADPSVVVCTEGWHDRSMVTARSQMRVDELITLVEKLEEQFEHLEHGI